MVRRTDNPISTSCEGEENKEPTSITGSLDEVGILCSFVLLFKLDSMADLVILIRNKFVLQIAVGVILSKDLHCLVYPTLPYQVSRALRNEDEIYQNNERSHDLKKTGRSPGPICRAPVEGAVAKPGACDAANVIVAVE